MPIYEYRCTACGHEMEAIQRISADPLSTCPTCGKDALKRLISQTSFMLKGGGWYATDYAGKKTHGSESKAPSSGGDSGGSKKPEAKAPSTTSGES